MAEVSEEKCSNMTVDEVSSFNKDLNYFLSTYGLECESFLVGWYNDQVSKYFYLPYAYNTVACVIISKPSMFEKALIPYLKEIYQEDEVENKVKDPVDQCMAHTFKKVGDHFKHLNIHFLHDFEMSPSRRPKVLVQTAGHVSGAVKFYQRKDLINNPWPVDKTVFGVCLHPAYGGWFALRGIAVLSQHICPSLARKLPKYVSLFLSLILKIFVIYYFFEECYNINIYFHCDPEYTQIKYISKKIYLNFLVKLLYKYLCIKFNAFLKKNYLFFLLKKALRSKSINTIAFPNNAELNI